MPGFFFARLALERVPIVVYESSLSHAVEIFGYCHLAEIGMIVGDDCNIRTSDRLSKAFARNTFRDRFTQRLACDYRIIESKRADPTAGVQGIDHLQRHRTTQVIRFRHSLESKTE